MITVAGGIYREFVLEPQWNQVVGSGGRAATAIAALGTEVELHSYLPAADRPAAEALANAAGVRLRLQDAPNLVSFEYVHTLSTPLIRPPAETIRSLPALSVSGDVVLRFGFMEGDAVVTGAKRAIYDPQSVHHPVGFRANGSRADELVVIANLGEALLLSGEKDPERAARTILATEMAEAVVIKLGPSGALVVDSSAKSAVRIPPYFSGRVWSLGSGDIFAAALTQYWGIANKAIAEAVDLASRSTCVYCRTRSSQLPGESSTDLTELLPVEFKMGKVYLAAPFFNLQERWMVEEARNHLLAIGLQVFSPLHDVGRGAASMVAPADLRGLDQCNRVFAIVDGSDPGTLFEIGYAIARGIPVVAFRQKLGAEDTKMLEGTGVTIVDDFVSAIYATAWVAR